MNTIHVLDCTLRDGGYCNGWRFGYDNAKKITKGLLDANVEIVECGFLTNKVSYDPDITKFTKLDEIAKIIPDNRDGKIFVAMMNYGEFNVDDIPVFDGSSIDGIRVAFHKKDRYEALRISEKIKEKGYLVFIQAMVSLSYSDEEFLETIHLVNKFLPYSFYIVDSFGMMKERDLIRLFYMIEHNLDSKIWIGFQCHTNLQLAFSNAQKLSLLQTSRNIIIDSSVYGMGRGAGNLNTELFIDYLNENAGKSYSLKPLLVIIDEILNDFYQRNYWGYSLPNYISAAHNAHPNYAGYLDDKKTLTIESMNEIFDLMEEEKKASYDKSYIEELYLQYMGRRKIESERRSELRESLEDKTILLVAPGKSSIAEREKIIQYANGKDVVVISVNHSYTELVPDYIFVSNLRRFRELKKRDIQKSIITSNISSNDAFIQTDYRALLNHEEAVSDNAGLMAIKFLMDYKVKKILLAGFDGYSHDETENYGRSDMAFITRNAVLDAINIGMSNVLREYSMVLSIQFITATKHVFL